MDVFWLFASRRSDVILIQHLFLLARACMIVCVVSCEGYSGSIQKKTYREACWGRRRRTRLRCFVMVVAHTMKKVFLLTRRRVAILGFTRHTSARLLL